MDPWDWLRPGDPIAAAATGPDAPPFSWALLMVRLRIHRIMRARRISAYALGRGAKLSYSTAYRLSRPDGKFGRLHAKTLESLCRFFRLQPGRLLEWIPGPRA